MNRAQKFLLGLGLTSVLSIPVSFGLNGHYKNRIEEMPYSQRTFTVKDMVKETPRFREYIAELNSLYENKETTEATAVTAGLVAIMCGVSLSVLRKEQ